MSFANFYSYLIFSTPALNLLSLRSFIVRLEKVKYFTPPIIIFFCCYSFVLYNHKMNSLIEFEVCLLDIQHTISLLIKETLLILRAHLIAKVKLMARSALYLKVIDYFVFTIGICDHYYVFSCR